MRCRFWSRRVDESCWMAAREYWKAGKWVRVTDDLNETRWVGINRPVRLMESSLTWPQHRATVMQQMQLQPGDPRLQQVVGIENDISDLDVDITIEEGIDIPSLQAEEFQIAGAARQRAARADTGRCAHCGVRAARQRQILERMKEHQQQQQQAQQQAGQLATQHAQADIQGKQAKAQADMALAQERKVNAAANVHSVHGEFSAPPDGCRMWLRTTRMARHSRCSSPRTPSR